MTRTLIVMLTAMLAAAEWCPAAQEDLRLPNFFSLPDRSSVESFYRHGDGRRFSRTDPRVTALLEKLSLRGDLTPDEERGMFSLFREHTELLDAEAGRGRAGGVRAAEIETLYAVPILQTDVNEGVFVAGMDEAGNRAVVEHYVPGALFLPNRTEIRLLTRGAAGWSGSLLLSRNDSGGGRRWIPGVTLAALAFSGDGRYLVFRSLEDIGDYDSATVKVLDTSTGQETALAGPFKGGGPRHGDEAAVAGLVTASGWFQRTYPGRSWTEVFPDPFRRCSGPNSVKAGIVGRQTLVVSREGASAYSLELKMLPGTSAWAFQDAWFSHAMSKDCSRGLIAVEEVLRSSRPSFSHGGDAHDAQVRLMEFGSTRRQ